MNRSPLDLLAAQGEAQSLKDTREHREEILERLEPKTCQAWELGIPCSQPGTRQTPNGRWACDRHAGYLP